MKNKVMISEKRETRVRGEFSARMSEGGLWGRVVYSRLMKGLTKHSGGAIRTRE